MFITKFQFRCPTAGRRRRHWRSRIGSQCRSDLTEQPETAAPGEPVPPAPGPAAGDPRRQAVRGLNGSLAYRAALFSGTFSSRSGSEPGGKSHYRPALQAAHTRDMCPIRSGIISAA
jgi:hypothetical protein